MTFKLKKLGVSRKIYKEWRCGDYRITWRSEVQGVKVPPAYHATVLVNGQWVFVGRHGTFKTFKKATEECVKHESIATCNQCR